MINRSDAVISRAGAETTGVAGPMRHFVMSAVILVTMLSGSRALGAENAPIDLGRQIRQGRLADSIAELKNRDSTRRVPYTCGARIVLPLKSGEAACLAFRENAPGAKEFLFYNARGALWVIYGVNGDEYKDYNATDLTSQRSKDDRTICAHGAPSYLECVTRWNVEGDRGEVTFQTRIVNKQAVDEEVKASKRRRLDQLRHTVVTWESGKHAAPVTVLMSNPDDPHLTKLRTDYHLSKLVDGARDEYEKLRRIVKWTHDRWKHSETNTPSKSDPLTILREASEGKQFRCVEYGTVLAACARSLGMPSRVLALKRADVETAESGAGHVVAEVWLAQFNKWVFADAQEDAIPEINGRPLNAIEFREAFANSTSGFTIRTSSGTNMNNYLRFAIPYLYYLSVNTDQRFYHDDHGPHTPGMVMLVPKGAKRPTVFQRTTPITNCVYISDPKAFYAKPR